MANERPLTLAEARKLLYTYATKDAADVEGAFRARINEALERISSDGIWEGLMERVDLTPYISAEILTLPYAYDALMAVAVDKGPTNIMDEGLEFTQGGPGVEDAGEGGAVVIDLGFNTVSGQEVRQYKFLMDIAATTTVEGLVKRRYVFLEDDSDLIYPSSVGALKHALFALHYEEEGDIDRAQQFWDKCYSILATQKATNNVGVVRTRPSNPWGFMTDKPVNMM